MSDANPGATWIRAADLARLRQRGRLIARLDGKQLALFAVGDRIFACNNRCPHEGYPLIEGHVDGAAGDDCVLTCNWHNWKFRLASGANLYGGDTLRVYPARVADGAVWVDVTDPPAETRVAAAFDRLRQAMDENQYDRIARELARLAKAGADPRSAVAHVIAGSFERLRDGMTHAYAAADVWLRLHDELRDDSTRLTCLAEAVGHVAYDTLREPAWPYVHGSRDWDAQGFLAAVEAQDEGAALAYARGALTAGAGLRALEQALAQAALAHYNDFGHSLIYLRACLSLSARFGREVDEPLLLAYVRSLVRATREDLVPEFRKYDETLAAWRASPCAARVPVAAQSFADASIGAALGTVLAARGSQPIELFHALLGAAATNLCRFDASHERRVDVTVADNIGWLDFTHGITFASAVRETCSRYPNLWPPALLQMALFVGRNAGYLGAADERWASDDVADFDAACRERVLNHGVGLYIHSAHLLKTWMAARTELAAAPPRDVATSLIGAVGRYLHAAVHQKRPLRTARQALEFVALED